MKKGFTLVEIIVVSLVISFFFALAVANYRFFNETKILEAETKKFAETLELAKKRTLSAEKKISCAGGAHTYNVDGVWYKVSWTASGYSLTPNGCPAEFTYQLPNSFTITSSDDSPLSFFLHTVNLFNRINKDLTLTVTNNKINQFKTIIVKKDGTITY